VRALAANIDRELADTRRPRLFLIDIATRARPQQQTSHTPLLMLIDGTDRWTEDERTFIRYAFAVVILFCF